MGKAISSGEHIRRMMSDAESRKNGGLHLLFILRTPLRPSGGGSRFVCIEPFHIISLDPLRFDRASLVFTRLFSYSVINPQFERSRLTVAYIHSQQIDLRQIMANPPASPRLGKRSRDEADDSVQHSVLNGANGASAPDNGRSPA